MQNIKLLRPKTSMDTITQRQKILATAHQDEHTTVAQILHGNPLSQSSRDTILNQSQALVIACRKDPDTGGPLDAFLLEFGLSNAEGVALMCMAEALLRIPDGLTADRLIAEKIKEGKWVDHRGQSESLFVNASTWGLMLTGHLVSLDADITDKTDNWVKKLSARLGEPLIRSAVMQAMRIMGGQYVLGRTIKEGLKEGVKHNGSDSRFSFDMLGEGARTDDDALVYFNAYSAAIDQIGEANQSSSKAINSADGISVKLSALHCRYYFSHYESVMRELLPRIKQLCIQAKHYNIGLSIDAEEAYRLELSLDIFQTLANDPDLEGWQGLGFVLQAYQKRAPDTAKWLIALAQKAGRRIMVRLVKGAYWDAEIKHAQELGLKGYPVFTRKANTDLCYQHCAELLLSAGDSIFAQFATHNAYTVTMILELAGDQDFEFQRLHGMGHGLYNQLKKQTSGRQIPVRIYAPIGNHRDLLPYLVRRLLENGANSSFVNRFLDKKTPVDELVRDTRGEVKQAFPYQHSMIPVPKQLFTSANEARLNSIGLDLDSPQDSAELLSIVNQPSEDLIAVHSIIEGKSVETALTEQVNPANNAELIGHYSSADEKTILRALDSAHLAQPNWQQLGPNHRADILDKVALYMEQDCAEMISILAREAGRTLNDGLSEVREAIDFCRYYALQARNLDQSQDLTYRGCGVFLCISPWNFPLAIFTGQIAAALATGNSVIAKPAMQTPMIASYAITLFHRAGIPGNVLHLLLGSGAKIGNLLVEDPRTSGIAFTGSTATATTINRQLASRSENPIPFIAETGGQNCMIVDSTALPEQVVDDVITSAFLSAGQRCSALRVLFLQQDIADNVLTMLTGAMASIDAGDPRLLSSDLGPVIDRGAQAELQAHITRMHREAKLVAKVELDQSCQQGSFIAPHVFELDSINQLDDEVFGPVLHVIRYAAKDLHGVIAQINATGYGLTLGIHSRIEAFAETVFRNTIAGNTYINRNMVGAVVGVNPFGGRGLSGTGPKAGGPNYLLRFSECTPHSVATEGEFKLKQIPSIPTAEESVMVVTAQKAMARWHKNTIVQRISITCKASDAMTETSVDSILKTSLASPILLPGPTGEENQLSLVARGVMLVIVQDTDTASASAKQIISALLCGCPVIIAAQDNHSSAIQDIQHSFNTAGLPKGLLQTVGFDRIGALTQHPGVAGVVANSKNANSQSLRQLIAQRDGSIIPLIQWPKSNKDYNYHWLLGFLSERTRTENLVARGGNTQLFNLAE